MAPISGTENSITMGVGSVDGGIEAGAAMVDLTVLGLEHTRPSSDELSEVVVDH